MLIYNFQKEFLGIDEKDLQELGFTDLSSLRSEVTDFADLFVKTPGYIHNFKHVHWIDFIDCAEDGEIPKVIINVNNKNFRANISITHAYLTDSPSSKAYLIHLNNLRILSDNEIENIHDDILQRPAPTLKVEKAPKIFDNTDEPSFTQEPIQQNIIKTNTVPLPDALDTKDVKLDVDISFNDNLKEIEQEELKHPPLDEHINHTKTIHKKEKFDNGYLFDPAIASKELGLPLDLIEEFIQDFIAQANEFKPELFSALDDGDIDNVKTLSHKLKGVAANLRIEDAFEVLATINTASDLGIIKTNLELFYKIMSKLAGEEIDKIVEVDEIAEIDKDIGIEVEKNDSLDTEVKPELTTQTQEMILDFKDEPSFINESEDQPEELNLSFKDDELILDFKDDESLAQEKQTDTKDTIEEIEISYSKNKVANEIGLDINSFNELFDDYIEEANNLIQQMNEAINNQDYTLLHTEALKLKGMSDNMRINNYIDELKLLMQVENGQEIHELLNTVQKTVNQLSRIGE